jgi:hypothetical protein
MFCPRCGLQQTDEDARFCKRCGMSLESLAQFVEAGGRLPAAEAADEAGALTPRQRGMRVGLVILIAGAMFVGIAILLTAMKDDLFVFLPVASIVFMIGVVRFLYGLLLEEGAPPRTRPALPAAAARRPLAEAATPASLPPARTVPIHAAHTAPGPDTKDMAEPRPSITDQTTKLLEEE